MKIRMLVLLLYVLLFTASAWARPFSVTCPIDGQPMYFSRQVGFGQNSVCWYSHFGIDPQTGRSSQHEGYVACND